MTEDTMVPPRGENVAHRGILPAAIELAAGLHPVFVLSRSKRPLANCRDCAPDAHHGYQCDHLTCHGHLAATTDADRIGAMLRVEPGGMLGLVTGVASGLVVVDVDPRNGGDRSLRQLMGQGILPRTSWVATGSDGTHLYYRHPGGRIPSRRLPGYPGIDIKGDGGYVVAPPSLHPDTGRAYEWRVPLGHEHEMHPRLISQCRAVPDAPAPTRVAPVATKSAVGITSPSRLLDSLLDAIRVAPEGRRRVTVYGSARGAARMVAAGALRAEDAITALTEAARSAQGSHPLSTAQITNAIDGGFSAEGVRS